LNRASFTSRICGSRGTRTSASFKHRAQESIEESVPIFREARSASRLSDARFKT
jgi:hypothetical protein